jgi:hypothetical protein
VVIRFINLSERDHHQLRIASFSKARKLVIDPSAFIFIHFIPYELSP